MTSEDILSLPTEERLILVGVARALKSRRASYVSLGEVRRMVEGVCEEYRSKPFTSDFLEDCIQDLADRGIIDAKGINHIGISGVSLEDMGRFLNNIMERMSDRLGPV